MLNTLNLYGAVSQLYLNKTRKKYLKKKKKKKLVVKPVTSSPTETVSSMRPETFFLSTQHQL